MAFQFPRCEVVPTADHQAVFRIDGEERLRWHYGPDYPRPFLYPLVGPSGTVLTRMGHPGAPNHDHHRSIWFAHNKVLGIDFWADRKPPKIYQKDWYCYVDGADEAVMAVQLGWQDGHDPKDLLVQDVIVAVRPGPDKELFLEIQTTFKPVAAELEFGKTNFGFLAVRVAKHLSAHFGGGELTGSDGTKGEPALFGKAFRWMDYSGPAPGGDQEGITYFDHPGNPGHPVKWHVREDGWMGASVCMDGPHTISKEGPLTLRYLLWAHRGQHKLDKAAKVFQDFSNLGMWELVKQPVKHTMWGVKRLPVRG
ncbi:MAG: PmoA family protein [Zavarzinella sp.]